MCIHKPLSMDDHIRYFLFSIYSFGSSIKTSFFFSSFLMIDLVMIGRPLRFSRSGEDSAFCFRAFSSCSSAFLFFFYSLFSSMHFFSFYLMVSLFSYLQNLSVSSWFYIFFSISLRRSRADMFFCSTVVEPISLAVSLEIRMISDSRMA